MITGFVGINNLKIQGGQKINGLFCFLNRNFNSVRIHDDSRGLDLQGTCYKCDEMGPLKSRVISPQGNPVIFSLVFGATYNWFFGGPTLQGFVVGGFCFACNGLVAYADVFLPGEPLQVVSGVITQV